VALTLRDSMPGVARVRLAPPRPPSASGPARLDDVQAAVVGRRQGSGPVVVLGAPGAGKTVTLIEAVVARVQRDGVPPDAVLVLAASRTAAAQLRMRITARLARTVREPAARTPHSYAFGLLRRVRAMDGDPPPRLISGPEQDRLLADLLAGHERGHGSPPPWPASIDAQLRSLRGFRDELRELLMRAVERGLGPLELAELGERTGRPDWVAAAHVLEEYLDVSALATPGGYDPAAIVDAATVALERDPLLLAAERDRWQLVAVDDVQEATAAAHRLIDQLVDGGRDLIVTGDADSATQTFRGARPQLVGQAAARWARSDGQDAPVAVLPVAHRQRPVLRAVTARVAERIGIAGVAGHRRATAVPGRPGAEDDGVAEVHLLPSPAQEAAFVAARLRRLHLELGVSWGSMAVVVRSAHGTEPLRRALAAAGVPVGTPRAEVTVRDEPAVVPLRLAMACALDPDRLTPDLVADLLSGPIGMLDPVAMRRLRQALRELELAGGGGRASDVLLVELLTEPGTMLLLDPDLARGPQRVAAVLRAGAVAAAEPGATGETVLWQLWDAAGLADGLRRTALAGGPAGARADHDLDAVMTLFETAARYTDRLPLAGAADFLAYLEGQDLPADTLAERAPDDDAVALVTAQGAAGREWDVVVVAGVQEGSWPDLRLRSSLLGAQQLADLLDGRGGSADALDLGVPGRPGGDVAAARRAALDDELRTFHVAVSRARRQLVVTAVRSEDELPSVFLDLVDPLPDGVDVRELSEVPRSMTLPALVAELRAVVTDEQAEPARRGSAAARLAALVRAGVPGAHPDDWYGLPALSVDGPLREPGRSVAVSPSKVEQFERCALRWMLESAAGGTAASSSAQSLGVLVHELAQDVPDGDRDRLAELLADRIRRLGLAEGWVGDRDRERAETMIRKLADYVSGPGAGRELIAVEQDVRVTIGRAVIRGQVDRLERDGAGRLVVVDLKTGRSQPGAAELPRNAQLGVYQLAVEEGGFEQVAPDSREPGGAVLVQLGTTTKGVGTQQQPALGDDPDPGWARSLVERVADGMAGDSFPAAGNPMCRMCAVRRACPLQPEGRQVGE